MCVLLCGHGSSGGLDCAGYKKEPVKTIKRKKFRRCSVATIAESAVAAERGVLRLVSWYAATGRGSPANQSSKTPHPWFHSPTWVHIWAHRNTFAVRFRESSSLYYILSYSMSIMTMINFGKLSPCAIYSLRRQVYKCNNECRCQAILTQQLVFLIHPCYELLWSKTFKTCEMARKKSKIMLQGMTVRIR
jgi:hypothetical protein